LTEEKQQLQGVVKAAEQLGGYYNTLQLLFLFYQRISDASLFAHAHASCSAKPQLNRQCRRWLSDVQRADKTACRQTPTRVSHIT
jgi:hypothetical protein